MRPWVANSKASIRRQGLQPPQTQAAKGHSQHITLNTDGASHTSHLLSVTAMISGNGTQQLHQITLHFLFPVLYPNLSCQQS